MPQALPSGPGTVTFTGARAFFYFNGEIVGWASGVSGSEEIQYEDVATIGHLEAREHAPVGYRVTFTATIFRTISRGTVSNGETAPGSLKQQNIFPTFGQILKLEGVDVSIVDSVSKKTIFQLERVKTASYQFSATARSISAQNVTFVAIRAKDESEITALPVAA